MFSNSKVDLEWMKIKIAVPNSLKVKETSEASESSFELESGNERSNGSAASPVIKVYGSESKMESKGDRFNP